MVFQRQAVEARLKELDRILQELAKYRDLAPERFETDLGLRWVIERGLIAAAAVVFDVADHILVGQYGVYADTYGESLAALRDQGVISAGLYDQLRGLGGLRNILVHRYLDIDPRQVADHARKGMDVFPRFGQEIMDWMDKP